MNRREFIQCIAILSSGVVTSQIGFTLTKEQRVFLATGPNYIDRKVDYLTPVQRKIIAAMAEKIIPGTETPGAIAAGVPRFIELMAADWFNEEEKAIFEAGIAEMESRIPTQYGKQFDELNAAQQLRILEKMESAASHSDWYKFGNVRRDFISDAPFICQVKELTIWGFFTSEVGCKQVLRYNPMPMKFDGDFPLAARDSSWVSQF